jgi:serine/threonine kinase 16
MTTHRQSHFQRGNLQDAINANVVNRTSFSEKEMLRLFRGTCQAVSTMHDYCAPLHSRKTRPSSAIPASALPTSTPTAAAGARPPNRSSKKGKQRATDDADYEDERFPQPDGDTDQGYSYDGKNESSVPLVSKNSGQDDTEVVFDGDEELEKMQNDEEVDERPENESVHVPYAHRDIKPG